MGRNEKSASKRAAAVWGKMNGLKADGIVLSAIELERIATGTLRAADVEKIKREKRRLWKDR